MTNYSSFPKHRRYGIVIKFNDSSYSWCENKPAQRKYLAESKYCEGAVEFYVWKNNAIYKDFTSFKAYLLTEDDSKPKSKRSKPSPIDESSKLYFTCKCIMCEISGYPYEAPKSHKLLAQECKKFLAEVLAAQTKNRKVYDLIFACNNLGFYGHRLAWNKNEWIKSSLIVYNYFKAKTIADKIQSYERIFNNKIVYNYNELLEYFYKVFNRGESINYLIAPGLGSNFSLVPIQTLEEKEIKFKNLYE